MPGLSMKACALFPPGADDRPRKLMIRSISLGERNRGVEEMLSRQTVSGRPGPKVKMAPKLSRLIAFDAFQNRIHARKYLGQV